MLWLDLAVTGLTAKFHGVVARCVDESDMPLRDEDGTIAVWHVPVKIELPEADEPPLPPSLKLLLMLLILLQVDCEGTGVCPGGAGGKCREIAHSKARIRHSVFSK